MGKISKALEKSKNESKVHTVSAKKETRSSGRIDNSKTDQADWNRILVQKPYSMEAEHFKVLKNSLLFPESGKPPRTIMVTSTARGDGKSFVTSNLAVAFASSIDEHVLLIDCDLHKPTAHKMFGLDNHNGLSGYLTDGGTLSSFMMKTFLKKLTLLPAGPPPVNPSELISSEQMRLLINEVESRYSDRYILFDSPPSLLTSETNAIAKHVDGLLLVVKHGCTKKKHIHDIIDIFGKEKILGVVYNFSQDKFGFNTVSQYRYGYE